MQRYGITIPFDGIPLADQRDLVAELPDLGYTDVWSSEVDGADAFTPLVLASVWAPALRLGTAIAPVFTRGPATLAQCAASLAAAAPGRVAIGIGASSDVIVERWNGLTFNRPLQRVRDTARFLRAALAGDKVTERYETFAVDGFRLGLVPEEPPRLLIAALRPGMLGLAGRESDGAILNWLAPGDVAAVAPRVHQGGPGKEIAARIFVAATADVDAARALGRRALAAYLNVPVYRAFHEWLGRGERLAPMWKAWAAGDRRGALAALDDDLVDELLVHGSPEACGERLQQYVEAGVHTPILAVLPAGGDIRDTVRGLGPYHWAR
jgi:probable F420-dependent oxidoreductase